MPKQHALDRVMAMALEPWAMTPDMLRVCAGVLSRRLIGLEKADANFLTRPITAPTGASGGAAVISMHGVIAPRMNLMSDISGGTTFEEATRQVREAAAAPEVSTIILDWDSPGGSVAGATEFAHEVLKARSIKPVISQANHQMCSAAYWTGCCATEVVASPSACIGSIGVYTIHEDLSKAFDQLGVKVTYLAAGKYKVDGNDAEPLSESARSRILAMVNARYERFLADVALGRGVPVAQVRSGFGEGSVLTADDALAAGMVDRIATLDETVSRVLSSSPSRQAFTSRAASVVPPIAAAPQESSETTGSRRPDWLIAAETDLLLMQLQ